LVAQITPPVASSPVALLANSLLLVMMSPTRRTAANRFDSVSRAMTNAGGDPQPGLLAVDAARVPDDQGGQQPEQDDRDHPRWVHPVLGGQCHMQGNDDDDRQRHRPPALTTFTGPQRRHRGRSLWLPA
jgi:hypothetical protein